MDIASSSRLTAVDTAWLRMDGPRNLMSIVGVWTLQPAIAPRALRQRLQQRLVCHARFRQKVVQAPIGARWVDDPLFDLARHVVSERLPRRPGVSEEAALQARVGALAMQPFDPAHPLWQMHVLRTQGGSAIIFRLHHCIADGTALFALLASLADGAAELRPAPDEESAAKPDDPLAEMWRPWHDALARAAGDPVGALQQGAQALRDGFGLVTQVDDSATRLKGPLDGVKLATWSAPLPLDQVKATGRALGGSVNDLLLACIAGALGQWLREQGDDPGGQHIRAMVPVNLRPPGQAWRLGNCFGLAPVLLPIGIDDIGRRVAEVHQRMDEMKQGFKPRLAYHMLQLSGRGLKSGQDLMIRLANDKTTAVMTNVPGPTAPLSLCGSTVQRYIVWVPSTGELGVGASIVSYAGALQFGLITDRARCNDPQRVVALFEAEYQAAVLAAEAAAAPPTRRAAKKKAAGASG
jgi:WS/DGAT/MGAT family acyltransferase